MTDETEPDPAAGAVPAPDPAAGPRRYPSTIGGGVYIAVLAAAATGLAVVGFGDNWRVGIRILAGSLIAAGLMRTVLPERDAGMLAVRNRWLDVGLLLAAAAALILLSITIPDQPV
jgi:hypothetical protein